MALLLAAGVLCLLVSSCQEIAWLTMAIDPPQPVKAVYAPPKDKKFLVLVDQFSPEASQCGEPIKDELSKRIGDCLLANKVAGSVIAHQKLLDLEESDPDFAKRNIGGPGGVAQKLGADYVVYVRIERFSVKDDLLTTLWKGRLEVTVGLVDAKKEGLVWPKDQSSGHPMRPVQTQTVEDPSPSFGGQIARNLAAELSDDIVKLFYDHKHSEQEEDKKNAQTHEI